MSRNTLNCATTTGVKHTNSANRRLKGRRLGHFSTPSPVLWLSLWLLLGLSNQALALTEPSARQVRITTSEFAPWTGEHLPKQGLVNHIIQEAFATQGVKVEFVYLPWKRAFEEARQNRFDATSYWYDSSERREAMLFSEPLVVNRTVFFQRASSKPIHWSSFNDLSGYRLSATVGFTYTPEFHQAVEGQVITPLMVPSDIQNLKLLMAERTDLFATDEMAGFYMAAQLNIDPRKLRVIEPPLSAPEGYLMASKSHPDAHWLISTFNTGFALIKKNGSYQKILERGHNTGFYDPLLSLNKTSAGQNQATKKTTKAPAQRQ